MRKIFLPPELYLGIEYMDNETKGKLFDLIYRYNLGMEYCISDELKMIFGFFKPFFDNDLDIYKGFCEKQQNNGKLGGRPKKDWDNSQKPKKPKKPIEVNRIDNILYIINKEEIKEILTEEEIQQNINPLKIISKMVDMGHKVEKNKKAIGEDIKWITELTKQYIPLKENGYPQRSEAIKITDGRMDYWKNPPKGKKYPTNFKNSLRTSFSIFTKPRG